MPISRAARSPGFWTTWPARAERANAGKLAFGTVDSWLVWNLTSGKKHLTDASNASRTMLYNIHTGKWDEEILRLFNIPASMLPEVRSSSELYGDISTSLGLEQVPLGGIAGDQQAALFGQTCVAPGLTKNTYGTGCFMLQNTGEKAVASRNRLLTTVAWKIGERTEYALEGSVFIGGAVVQWLRDGLRIIRSAAEIEALAASVPDNGGVYLVPAFAGLGAPHWDPYARGVLAGISRGTTAAHLARAALEGIAYQVADLLDAMHADAGIQLAELRVDGGAAMNNLLMQFQADLLGVPVVRPAVTETTALGCRLSGRSGGWFLEEPSGSSRTVAGGATVRAADAFHLKCASCANNGTARWGAQKIGRAGTTHEPPGNAQPRLRAKRAVGHGHHWRRCDRRWDRRGCRFAGLRCFAPRTERFRERHFQPQH